MSSPLYTEVGKCWFIFVRSVSLSFLSVRLSSGFYRTGRQTRDVDLMLAHRL